MVCYVHVLLCNAANCVCGRSVRWFESRSGHGCLYLVFICCVVLCR
jgi:hypothetical protein